MELVNSKGKVLAIALGALALFVGGVAVATAAGPAEAPQAEVKDTQALSAPVFGIILCKPPPGSTQCGPG